ncbi:MAG: single-stranded-DNA-specific exonuclease RecJ [Dehalococcoidia bacterium]|nr:MAG: single-stranded-DNA-specific exonuclease RecJ [Dehalococcoidia bacterium]
MRPSFSGNSKRINLNHYHWNLLPNVPEEYIAIVPELPPLISKLLYNRGITDPSQAHLFFNPDERLSVDPFLLPDIHPAINRIYKALLSAESIAIYGDFDVDGITGTALLMRGFKALGANVTPYIPQRLNEGHGLNDSALDQLKNQGIKLVITVDCGVTAISPTENATRKGLDIIITDHHTPSEKLPSAIAVVDPKRSDSAYPFSELSGVGVAFKLLQALYHSIGNKKQLDKLFGLVAIGTIADMMPLIGENRYLVKKGLSLLRESPELGFKEMAQSAKIDISSLSPEDISWIIAPRLNSAGRLESAMISYKLLMAENTQEAQELASILEKKNIERQRLTSTALLKARKQVISRGIGPLLIVSDFSYPVGILGLIAGKLSSEYYRPVIAIKKGVKLSSGSCRSIPEFNIIRAISQCSSLLTHFGGHTQAAGFTLPTENLVNLERQLYQLANRELSGIELFPQLDIDTEIILDELDKDTFQAIQLMAPFGQCNPPPVFLSRCVKVADCCIMGNNGDHLRLKIKHGSNIWDAVAFGMGNRLLELKSSVDIVYNIELNKWGGEEKLRLNLLDFSADRQL